eukprot:87552-Rhodomonas_salina.1
MLFQGREDQEAARTISDVSLDCHRTALHLHGARKLFLSHLVQVFQAKKFGISRPPPLLLET